MDAQLFALTEETLVSKGWYVSHFIDHRAFLDAQQANPGYELQRLYQEHIEPREDQSIYKLTAVCDLAFGLLVALCLSLLPVVYIRLKEGALLRATGVILLLIMVGPSLALEEDLEAGSRRGRR